MIPDAAESFNPAPRIVRPRTRTYKRLPVVAMNDIVMLTEQGEVRELDFHLDGDAASLETLTYFTSAPPTLFAKRAAADFISILDRHFNERDPNHWQWRASVHERDIVRPDGVKVASRVSTIIHYFGFKGGSYHKIIDPVVMYGHDLDTIWPTDQGGGHDSGGLNPPTAESGDALMRLLEWAVTLRNFCDKNGMEVRPTIGGIGSQFLTDRRFYPKRRRKVPMVINERAREKLPGNHYHLTVHPTPYEEFRALYLDQHRAHHYHARTVSLPDSNQLYAHGMFRNLNETVFKETWPDFYGLYCLDLQEPPTSRPSHWITILERAFVFSNELPHLFDMGYKVNGVYAAWGSFRRDTGIARYAKWASKQLDHYGDKPWLKPLLLSTYGTLATKPKYGESVFKLAKSGNEVTLVTGRNTLTGKHVVAPKKLEPRIANVIHRGMIEAATRSESVGYGQYLADQGFHVLSVYADAVIVEDDPDKNLPAPIDPWRLKQTLNHLQFINQQAFISGEMTKLPGVSREQMAYRQHTMPGYAPRMTKYEAITNRQIRTDRRI